MNTKQEKIQIKDLILWDENARFPDKFYNSDEKELIKYFLSNPKFEMKKFIDEIVKDFDLPQLEKLVVWNNENNFIVIEGNIRLCAYMLLANPDLTENHKIKEFISTRKTKINIDESFKIECILSDDESTCLRYVDRKHIRKNNEVRWEDGERANYDARRGNKSESNLVKIGIIKIVRELDIPEEMKDRILGKGFVTTFFRGITSTPAKRKYGYKILKNGELKIEYSNFKKELKVAIFTVLNKVDFEGNKVDSRTLNKTENIKKFIENIKPEQSKQVDKEIENNTSENLFGDKSTSIGNNSKTTETPKHSKSKHKPTGLFLSSDIPFKIGNSSLRILYNELKDIPVSDFPNATHDLLRSFLECTLIVYFKKTGEYAQIQKNQKHNPTLGEMLTHIINNKSESIKDVNIIETVKQIKTDFDKPYSLERLNMINHNENWVAKEREVRETWARLEGLFKLMLSTK